MMSFRNDWRLNGWEFIKSTDSETEIHQYDSKRNSMEMESIFLENNKLGSSSTTFHIMLKCTQIKVFFIHSSITAEMLLWFFIARSTCNHVFSSELLAPSFSLWEKICAFLLQISSQFSSSSPLILIDQCVYLLGT